MGIGAFGNWRGCGEDVRDGVKLEARAVPVVGVGVALSLSRLLLPSGRFGERGWGGVVCDCATEGTAELGVTRVGLLMVSVNGARNMHHDCRRRARKSMAQ